jgi:hypothetical protein
MERFGGLLPRVREAVWVLVLCSCGCAPTFFAESVAIGPPGEPIRGCTLDVESKKPNPPSGRVVGTVCIAKDSVAGDRTPSTTEIDSDPDALSLLRDYACRLGGDIAVPQGMCRARPSEGPSGPGARGIEYQIFRRE